MFVCTFAGHREIYHSDIAGCVRMLIDMILDQHDNVMFYNGGMGAYDDMCARLVNEAKSDYPRNTIQNILVIPYLTQLLNERREYYESVFDHIIVAKLPEGMHYKRAIQARNRWMADQSDMVIAYFYREFGGAYNMAKYAKMNGKTVINVAGGFGDE